MLFIYVGSHNSCPLAKVSVLARAPNLKTLDTLQFVSTYLVANVCCFAHQQMDLC